MVVELSKKVKDAEQNNENEDLYKITNMLSNRKLNGNHLLRDNKGELLTGWENKHQGGINTFLKF
jgi:hypothetical protein